jgi:hypothetical protein
MRFLFSTLFSNTLNLCSSLWQIKFLTRKEISVPNYTDNVMHCAQKGETVQSKAGDVNMAESRIMYN